MKSHLLFLYFLLLASTGIWAQAGMPTHLEVVRKFLSTYSHEREEPNDRIFFAKKKEGWFVQIANRYKNNDVKNQQLFWSLNKQDYLTLTGYGEGDEESVVQEKIDEALQRDEPPFLYGFERCRYFGDNEWDVDMIKDFGNSIPNDDTLLEGLARAYAFYADRYLWYGLGGFSFDNDLLKSKLGKLERPDRKRMDQFMAYTDKAIECYRKLAARSPNHKTLVGNAAMKVVNEQFHQYQQLMITGYTLEANKIIGRIEDKDSIYRRIGRSYLSACPPKAILITYGDNDCYASWYVQQKEGFRTDVTVLNNSLLGIPNYAHMLSKKDSSLFSARLENFGTINFDYFLLDEDSSAKDDSILSLPEFIKELQLVKYSAPGPDDTVASYRTKKIRLQSDIDRLKKICPQNNLASFADIELKDYLFLSDLLILDIINTNLYSRPVCFTVLSGFLPAEQMQQEGSVYRYLPLKNDVAAKQEIEIQKMVRYLRKDYHPIMLSYGTGIKYYEDVLIGSHTKLFNDLVSNYLALSENAKAREWIARYLSYPETKKMRPSFSSVYMAQNMLEVGGYKAKATSLLEEIARQLYDNYKNYSALENHTSKERLLQMLRYFKDLLQQKDITSKFIEDLMADVSEEN